MLYEMVQYYKAVVYTMVQGCGNVVRKRTGLWFMKVYRAVVYEMVQGCGV